MKSYDLRRAEKVVATVSTAGLATEVTLAGIEAQTDLLTFTGTDLNVNATVSFPAGAERPIELVEVTINGSTLSGVQSVSLLFDGNGGSIDGISVDNRYVAEFSPNNNNDTLGSIPFTVPTSGAGRILISYVKEI